MSDDLSKKGYPDRTRINVRQVFEVSYWTKQFGCTKLRLTEVVKKVGPMVVDVKKEMIERITNAGEDPK